jgi:hypothetical protein
VCSNCAKESPGFKGKGWGSKFTPGLARQRGCNTQHTPPGMKHGMHHTTRHVSLGAAQQGYQGYSMSGFTRQRRRGSTKTRTSSGARSSRSLGCRHPSSSHSLFPNYTPLFLKHVPLFACGRLDCSPATPSRSRYGSCCAIYPAKCLIRSVPARSIERARPACALACHVQVFTSVTPVRMRGTGV